MISVKNSVVNVTKLKLTGVLFTLAILSYHVYHGVSKWWPETRASAVTVRSKVQLQLSVVLCVLNSAGKIRELLDTVKAKKLAYHEETRELPGERDNARNNARCTQARKATHGLDGQHQHVDRTLRGRVSQNDRGQG